jgi:hypothetical protein
MRGFVRCGLAIACVLATFGPWLRSGSSHRSSYDVIRAAEDLDVLHGWVQPTAAAGWYFVPLVAVLVLLATVADRPLPADVLLAVTGLAVTFLAVRLTFGRFSTDWGTRMGLASGIVAVVASAESMIHERRTRDRRTGAPELGT